MNRGSFGVVFIVFAWWKSYVRFTMFGIEV